MFVDQRPDDRVGLLWVPGLEGLRLVGEARHELVGDRALDDDLARRHADLPLVQKRTERRRVDRVLEVRVPEHDQRVVAAELEHDPLQVPARRLRELAAGGRRAREVDPADRLVLGEFVADRACLTGCVRDDVEHPGRQPRLGEDLTPQRPADDRRQLRRLEHDGVAERQRRRDRAGREDQGRVPGSDRSDDAGGPADAERERTRVVGGDHLPDRLIRQRRCLAEQVRDEVHLEHAEAERAAGLAREQCDHLVLAGLEDVGGLEEDALPLGRPRLRPRRERGRSRLDRLSCLLRTAGRHLRDHVAGVRIEILERLLRCRHHHANSFLVSSSAARA